MQTTPAIPPYWYPSRLILLGGSVRAAAMSAVSARFRVLAIDRFGDQDLREICESWHPWQDGPDPSGSTMTAQLAKMTAQAPDQPTGIVLTGGGEAILSPSGFPELPADRNLRWLTASASAIKNSSDPTNLAAIAAAAGIHFPQWRQRSEINESAFDSEPSSPDPFRPDQWLFKPLLGWGGMGIRQLKKWKPADLTAGYLQKRITGVLFGASFVASANGTACLGVSRGLTSKREPAPFRYCGSVGPINLSQNEQQQIERLGSVAAQALQLQGLFGIDFLVSPTGWHLLEINPRFCASMELYDNGSNSPIAAHVAAFTQQVLPRKQATSLGSYRCKHIVYAEQEYHWDQATAQSLAGYVQRHPGLSVHDLPVAGTKIAKSAPLFTIRTTGATARQVLRKALKHDHQWQRS